MAFLCSTGCPPPDGPEDAGSTTPDAAVSLDGGGTDAGGTPDGAVRLDGGANADAAGTDAAVTADAGGMVADAAVRDDTLPPTLLMGVTIPIEALVGVVMQGGTGTWEAPELLSFTYTWMRCATTSRATCSPILGATGSSYTPTTLDVGFRLTLRVTASNVLGVLDAVSNFSNPCLLYTSDAADE